MLSKRSSEWSVTSRSSLPWITLPRTVEQEHGGPRDPVRDDNPPMVLNPLGNQSLHPNSRTNDTAAPMILWERYAFRCSENSGHSMHAYIHRPPFSWVQGAAQRHGDSLASRGEVSPLPGSRRDHGKMIRRAEERGCSENEGGAEWHESRRSKRDAERCQSRRAKPMAPTEANWSTEVICTEMIASHRAKPIAPNEAGRAEGEAKKPTARRDRESKGSSGGTCFFGADGDDSEG